MPANGYPLDARRIRKCICNSHRWKLLKRLNSNIHAHLYCSARPRVSKIINPVLLESPGHYFRLLSSNLRKRLMKEEILEWDQSLVRRSISKRQMKLKEALFQRKTERRGERNAGNSGGPTGWLCFGRDSVSLTIFPTCVFILFDFPLPDSIWESHVTICA